MIEKRRPARAVALAALLCTATACAPPPPRNTGVYLLLDTSGTYTQELDKAKQIINYTLSRLDALDSFAVARIDTGSFSERDIMVKVTLDDRPSAANVQKREFAQTVERTLADVEGSPYTDITGGLLQAVEFLNEKQPGRKTIFVFSDLKEDLEPGYVRDISVPVDGFDVVALNVTKLRSDNVNPREYLERLETWRRKVEAEGGRWRVVNDLDRLETLL
jgi:hypothetical protein